MERKIIADSQFRFANMNRMKLPLWKRREFFDSYGNRDHEHAAQLPPRGIRFSCPCCGYPTLGKRDLCGICPLCWWEDDGQDDQNADESRGGPNHGWSLSDARLNFEQYLVMYIPEFDRRIGGPDCTEEREAKKRLIEAFDAITDCSTPEELNKLWKVVDEEEHNMERIRFGRTTA